MQVDTIVKLLKEEKENGNTVFVCGNGGSAATAEHFTNDLFSKGVRAICLNSNVSIMTMIANDYGYEYIFQKQLELYAEPGDLVIVFSVSGKSENIVALERLSFITVVKIFGWSSESYQDAENRHLILVHEISSKI